MTCKPVEFVNCDLADRSKCDVDFFDLDRKTQDDLMLLQLRANATSGDERKALRHDYEQLKAAALDSARACRRASNTDHRHTEGAVTMEMKQLTDAAAKRGIKTDGLDARSVAIAVVDSMYPGSSFHVADWRSRPTAYLTHLAVMLAANHEQAAFNRDAMLSYATVRPDVSCACEHGDSADPERAARSRMVADGANVWRTQTVVDTVAPAPKADDAARDEASARAAMAQRNRNAWKNQE